MVGEREAQASLCRQKFRHSRRVRRLYLVRHSVFRMGTRRHLPATLIYFSRLARELFARSMLTIHRAADNGFRVILAGAGAKIYENG
jgi:hypothetical protein